MSQFKASVEKLEKGWSVSFTVPDFSEAQEVIEELHEESGEDRKFDACSKKNSDGTYSVKVYQSKLSQAQALIKEMFLKYRDDN